MIGHGSILCSSSFDVVNTQLGLSGQGESAPDFRPTYLGTVELHANRVRLNKAQNIVFMEIQFLMLEAIDKAILGLKNS